MLLFELASVPQTFFQHVVVDLHGSHFVQVVQNWQSACVEQEQYVHQAFKVVSPAGRKLENLALGLEQKTALGFFGVRLRLVLA